MGVEFLPGNDIFKKKITSMEAHAINFTPALDAIERSFWKFENETWDLEGPGWEPLSPNTIIRKAGLSDEMLVRGGPGSEGLKQSLTSRSSGSMMTITPFSVTLGTSVSYAQYHQYGDGVPQRKIVDMESARGAALIATWFKILEAYFIAGASGANAVRD